MRKLVLTQDSVGYRTKVRIVGTNVVGTIVKDIIYPTFPPKYLFTPEGNGKQFYVFESEFTEIGTREEFVKRTNRKWKSR
ncbi:hypothetical protein ACWN8V_06930 [Vagococcus elongatus]|uniref:Uncharacterized protein n=1 Tax=Vagococcus elongatus TaxID=180344 RepID=A0A430AW40_9ENTE|nr:hypothetical protein [Vagococcus elongatus]RSU12268.1 hypothetical protein CBF29_06620 [Vagococcus elongatus]